MLWNWNLDIQERARDSCLCYVHPYLRKNTNVPDSVFVLKLCQIIALRLLCCSNPLSMNNNCSPCRTTQLTRLSHSQSPNKIVRCHHTTSLREAFKLKMSQKVEKVHQGGGQQKTSKSPKFEIYIFFFFPNVNIDFKCFN